MDFRIAVDASVAVKWHIKDESDAEKSLDILLDYKAGKIDFVVPRLFYYETANAIYIAVQRKRITEDDGKDIVNDVMAVEMTVIDSAELLKNAYSNARKYNISVYDSIYFTLAKEQDVLFYTADKKFYNSMKDKKKFVKWIGDYKRMG